MKNFTTSQRSLSPVSLLSGWPNSGRFLPEDNTVVLVTQTGAQRTMSRENGSDTERQLIVRELSGLRYSYKDAGPVMEDLDPIEWGAIRRLARLPGAHRKSCR